MNQDTVHISYPYNGEKMAHEAPHENDLARQLTLSLSSEQYERLFFQPTPPRGDLTKRLGLFEAIRVWKLYRLTQILWIAGNPTLLGLCGFLVPMTPVVLCLLGFQGGDSSCKK